MKHQTSFIIDSSDSPFHKAMMLRCFTYLRDAYAANGYNWIEVGRVVGICQPTLDRIIRLLVHAGFEFINAHGRRQNVRRKTGGDGSAPPASGASGPDQPPSG